MIGMFTWRRDDRKSVYYWHSLLWFLAFLALAAGYYFTRPWHDLYALWLCVLAWLLTVPIWASVSVAPSNPTSVVVTTYWTAIPLRRRRAPIASLSVGSDRGDDWMDDNLLLGGTKDSSWSFRCTEPQALCNWLKSDTPIEVFRPWRPLGAFAIVSSIVIAAAVINMYFR